MTSESLRSQVEKRIAEPLITEEDLDGWIGQWWQTGRSVSQQYYLKQKINEKAKARDEQVLTLIDEMAKELEGRIAYYDKLSIDARANDLEDDAFRWMQWREAHKSDRDLLVGNNQKEQGEKA